MRVWLNGIPREAVEGVMLATLLEEAGTDLKSGAVAVNMAVVPRSRIGSIRLGEGDRVEVIEAVGGG